MAESDTETGDDAEQTDDYQCACGDAFPNEAGLNGHKATCDEQEPDADGETDEDESATDAPTRAVDGFSLIGRADVFQEFLSKSHGTDLIQEAKIRVNQDGVATTAVDPANVGMIDLHISPQAFESYEVGASFTIGVNLGRLDEIISPADVDQLVHYDYDPERRTATIEWGGHSWRMALIDPGSIRREPDIPELGLPVRATVDAGALQDGTRFAEMVSDHVSLGAVGPSSAAQHDATLYVAADGDTDEYRGELENGGRVDFGTMPDAAAETNSLFSLDYLRDIVAVYDADTDVSLELGQEFPLKLHSDVTVPDSDGDEQAVGSCTFMLAPRIQSE